MAQHLFNQQRYSMPMRFKADFLTGLQHAELQQTMDMMTNDMILRMNAYALKEQAGEIARGSVIVDLPIKPRWIPMWLWKKIPTRRATWEVTAKPEWTYPSASITIPRLGHPVAITTLDYDGMDPETD